MFDPYLIDGPASLAFSGGRTSAYLLHKVLKARGGRLPKDVHVLFANTGMEREETLRFVHDVETHWEVPVHWLEYRPGKFEYAEVDFENAARGGEPFRDLLDVRGYPPTPVMRFCTEILKIRVMRNFMHDQGYKNWIQAVGIRADEPSRVARMAGNNSHERWDVVMPLAAGDVTKNEVLLWWKQQPFDLQLQQHEGNCTLCFLKSRAKKLRIMRDRPDLAAWWIEQEKRLGKPFRLDAWPYQRMLDHVQAQPELPFAGDLDQEDALTDCFCGDAA